MPKLTRLQNHLRLQLRTITQNPAILPGLPLHISAPCSRVLRSFILPLITLVLTVSAIINPGSHKGHVITTIITPLTVFGKRRWMGPGVWRVGG
jgi:hypothetical protein